MAELRLVDSITELTASDRDCIAVSGSHGGLSSARFALVTRPRLSVFNDAGVGKDGAGLAGLALLQQHGLAAATVSHQSARIGDARSTHEEGVISHLNALARAMGLNEGQPCREAIAALTTLHHL